MVKSKNDTTEEAVTRVDGPKPYYFPDAGVSVMADNAEEAVEKLDELLKSEADKAKKEGDK